MLLNALNTNRDKEYRLEPFFELSPDLLCIAGFDGYFKRINPAVSNLLGYTNQELMSRSIQEFIHPEDREITEKHRDLLRKNVPLLNFENRYITKNGEIVWLSWTSMPLYHEGLVYAIAKNVTHKKKLEEGRNILLASLTKTNNDLKQLTYSTSHDLRSPINNLLTIFSLLDVSKVKDRKVLGFIEMLNVATKGLKATLNNYINLLRKNGSLTIQTEELNFNETLNATRESIKSLIQTSNATFNIDFSEVENIEFNKTYLESTLLNLITNSIKYAKPGTAPVISIYTRKVKGVNQLVYSDNGLGFDMEKVKDKIFGLHQTFHNHSDSKGIGLYLVYNHITSLGGQITVESKVNEGTTFTISFKS